MMLDVKRGPDAAASTVSSREVYREEVILHAYTVSAKGGALMFLVPSSVDTMKFKLPIQPEAG